MRVAAEEVQIAVDLDRCFLGRILGVGLVLQQRVEQKVDGSLTGLDQGMKQLLFAGKDAADAIGLEFGIGCRHRSWAMTGSPYDRRDRSVNEQL